MNDFSERTVLYAIADIGANSVRMSIYEIDTETGAYQTTASARSMLGLAAYVENGALTADGRGKLFTVMREFLARANSVPCDRFLAFATASLRGLSDGDEILSELRTRLGIEVELISGETEARLDFEAVHARFPEARRGVVIDMGGGSTELIPFENGEALSVQSLPIGCVALAKRFASVSKKAPFPTEEALDAIRAYAAKTLAAYPTLASFGGTAYLVGGTARAIAKLSLESTTGAPLTDGYSFSAEDLQKTADAAFCDARTGGKFLQKVVPDRLTSVLPGIAAYTVIAKALSLSDFVVSAAGVREGYLLDIIRREFTQKSPET